MEFPELAQHTRGFTAGAPRAISVSADGSRVCFLRSGPSDPAERLWVFDADRGTERLGYDPTAEALAPHSTEGIAAYALDRAGCIAALVHGGRLVIADLADGSATVPLATPDPTDPVPDPTGRRIAYLS